MTSPKRNVERTQHAREKPKSTQGKVKVLGRTSRAKKLGARQKGIWASCFSGTLRRFRDTIGWSVYPAFLRLGILLRMTFGVLCGVSANKFSLNHGAGSNGIFCVRKSFRLKRRSIVRRICSISRSSPYEQDAIDL